MLVIHPVQVLEAIHLVQALEAIHLVQAPVAILPEALKVVVAAAAAAAVAVEVFHPDQVLIRFLEQHQNLLTQKHLVQLKHMKAKHLSFDLSQTIPDRQ